MSAAEPPKGVVARALDRVYAVERTFVGFTTAVMGAVVLLDVIHNVASRERTIVETVVVASVALVGVFAALVVRGRAKDKTTALLAVGIVVGGWLALRALLLVLPNGLVWGQPLGLVLMLWIGLVGASMATRDHRHLALDLGSKLWPKRVLPVVQAGGNIVTALFCLVLAGLAVVSLRDHYGDWVDTDGAGGAFPALPLPRFVAFVIVPVGFGLMAVRFLLIAADGMRGAVEDDDPLHMLGIEATTANDAVRGDEGRS